MREYRALTAWQRLLYRLPRHPLIAHLLLPPLVFLLLYRVPFDTPRNWGRERRSVWLTNAALVAVFGALVLLVGWHEVLLVHVSIMAVGSILGVWLFSLQHRFETAHWMREWSGMRPRPPCAPRHAAAHHRLRSSSSTLDSCLTVQTLDGVASVSAHRATAVA